LLNQAAIGQMKSLMQYLNLPSEFKNN
jgi:hypothetical protein